MFNYNSPSTITGFLYSSIDIEAYFLINSSIILINGSSSVYSFISDIYLFNFLVISLVTDIYNIGFSYFCSSFNSSLIPKE